MAEIPADGTLGIRRHSALLNAAFLLFAVVYLYLRLFHAGIPILQGGDEVRLTYEALLNHRHTLIYRDFFEFSQPAWIFFYQAWGAVTGFGVRQMNYAILTFWLAVAVGMWQFGKRVVSARWAALAAAAAIFWCWRVHPLYHIAAVALLVGAVATLQPLASAPATPGRIFLAGLLTGVAFTTMQARGAAGAVVLFFWAWRHSGRRAALLFAGAAAAPVAATAGYFASHHAVSQWFDCTFVFPLLRARLGTWSGLHTFVEGAAVHTVKAAGVTLFFYAPVLLAVPVAWAALRQRDAPPRLQLLAWLVLGQFVASLYGPSLDRLLASAFPVFLIAAWFVGRMRRAKVCMVLAAVLMAVLFGRQLWRVHSDEFARLADRVGNGAVLLPVTHDAQRYQWVLARTSPGETVAFYPWENDLLFLGDLRAPARLLWLDEGGFSSPAEVASVIESLRERRPKLAMWNKFYRDDGSEPPLEYLKPLRRYLDEAYQPVARFPTAEVFELKTDRLSSK